MRKSQTAIQLERVALLVEQVAKQFRDIDERSSASSDGMLTSAHRKALESLWTNGPQLIAALRKSIANVDVLVELASMGLIATRPSESRGVSGVVELTTPGRRQYEAMRHSQRDYSRKLLVSERELKDLAHSLQTLSTALASVLVEKEETE